MKITAKTVLYWSALRDALKELGMPQTQLATESGVSATAINAYIRLKSRPSEEVIRKLEDVFIRRGLDIELSQTWPDSFKGFGKNTTIERTEDIPESRLLSYQPEQHLIAENNELTENLMSALNDSSIKDIDREIIRMKYGFDGEEMSAREIGRKIGISGQRVAQRINKTLRILRHPKRTRKIKPYFNTP